MSIKPDFTYGMPVLDGQNKFASGWQRQLSRVLTLAITGGASWTGHIQYTSVPAHSSADFVVQFDDGQATLGDTCVILGSPAPPANSCFTAHVESFNRVIVRFNNYSNGTLSTGPFQEFSLLLVPFGQN